MSITPRDIYDYQIDRSLSATSMDRQRHADERVEQTKQSIHTPMQAIFTQAIELVLAENQRVLQTITYSLIEQLAQKITNVERIFVIGEGRSGLAIRMAAMRLMHLGCQVHVVGETTTPSIRSTDLLIACSGSGSTETVCAIAAKAMAIGAYLVNENFCS